RCLPARPWTRRLRWHHRTYPPLRRRTTRHVSTTVAALSALGLLLCPAACGRGWTAAAPAGSAPLGARPRGAAGGGPPHGRGGARAGSATVGARTVGGDSGRRLQVGADAIATGALDGDERGVEHIVDVLSEDEVNVLAQILRHVLQVTLVVLGQDDRADAGAV